MLTAFLLAAAIADDDCCASMKTLAADPAFIALHLNPEQIDFTPKYGKMGKLAYDGGSAAVFLVPPRPGSSVGIVMIHEWWGLNDHIKREAERLHEATGYGVAAIDLYAGKVATTQEQASQFIRQVDDKAAGAIVAAAPKKIKDGSLFGRKLDKVGTIGYCFGGGWSLQTALRAGDAVDACVMYYGMPETDAEKLEALTAPVLGVFAIRDRGIGPDVVGKFAEGMARAGKRLNIRSYDAEHAFANPSNPRFNKEAADKAWTETLAFFRRYLENQ